MTLISNFVDQGSKRGKENGEYSHAYFRRDDINLCDFMKRVKKTDSRSNSLNLSSKSENDKVKASDIAINMETSENHNIDGRRKDDLFAPLPFHVRPKAKNQSEAKDIPTVSQLPETVNQVQPQETRKLLTLKGTPRASRTHADVVYQDVHRQQESNLKIPSLVRFISNSTPSSCSQESPAGPDEFTMMQLYQQNEQHQSKLNTLNKQNVTNSSWQGESATKLSKANSSNVYKGEEKNSTLISAVSQKSSFDHPSPAYYNSAMINADLTKFFRTVQAREKPTEIQTPLSDRVLRNIWEEDNFRNPSLLDGISVSTVKKLLQDSDELGFIRSETSVLPKKSFQPKLLSYNESFFASE